MTADESEVKEVVKDEKKAEGEEEYKVTLISDKSKAKVGIMHYIAIALWLGWFSFYFYFPIFFVVGMYTFPKVVGLVLAVVVTSAVYPIADKYQPKVSLSTLL